MILWIQFGIIWLLMKKKLITEDDFLVRVVRPGNRFMAGSANLVKKNNR